MKNTSQILRLGGLAALAAFGFSGCMVGHDRGQYASNGESAFIKEESENMGQVWNGEVLGATLAKASADTIRDTITGELIIVPLHYEAACQCFVRTADFTSSVGYERERQDTITLYGPNDSIITDFRPGLAERISHKRHIHRINPLKGKEVDVWFSTTLTWQKDANGLRIAGIWNGTIIGTFNGVVFKTGTIKDVVRSFNPLLRRMFGFPSSGSINLERLILGVNFTIDIVFEGEGKATVTITNSKNGSVHVIHIDVDNKER